ncbi:hypothetical protein MFC_01093 [Mesomycoplasma flocculare ATCC 27716]|nr:hypothetical protein MFC_01093 [Mesomycoplasma flocculare ATCC 27716]
MITIIPISLAIFATVNAAPEPVAPPRPTTKNKILTLTRIDLISKLLSDRALLAFCQLYLKFDWSMVSEFLQLKLKFVYSSRELIKNFGKLAWSKLTNLTTLDPKSPNPISIILLHFSIVFLPFFNIYCLVFG